MTAAETGLNAASQEQCTRFVLVCKRGRRSGPRPSGCPVMDLGQSPPPATLCGIRNRLRGTARHEGVKLGASAAQVKRTLSSIADRVHHRRRAELAVEKGADRQADRPGKSRCRTRGALFEGKDHVSDSGKGSLVIRRGQGSKTIGIPEADDLPSGFRKEIWRIFIHRYST